MKCLNILMTADTVGGVWQYAQDLAGTLARKGHRVTIASLGPEPSPDQRSEIADLDGVDLLETGLPLDWLAEGPDPVLRAASEIDRIARTLGVDVIHCNSPALLGAGRFAVPALAVTHGCVATWWQAARRGPLAPEFHWHRDLVEAGLRAADAVVAPTRSFAQIVARTYGLTAHPQAVHNGREPLPLPFVANACAPYALTAGRLWDDAKCAAVMDRAAADLAAPFFAAGALHGPNGEAFEPSHLQPLGPLGRDALAGRLAHRPVFVSAASFEPFGLAVLESAQAGCPLVLSDIGTFRELWGGAALFVDADDAPGFARAIATLLSDESRRSALGRAAAERARRYTPERMADATEALYARLSGLREAA